jgi:nitroreductase
MKYLMICLACMLTVSACSSTVKDNALPPEILDRDLRLSLVDQARWAMSAHNMQPWEILFDGDDTRSFRIYLADDRLLPATDPFSRQIFMSIGGFIFLLEDAAAAMGYDTDTTLFPDGTLAGDDIGASFASPVAEVRIEPQDEAVEPLYLDAISSATVKANLQPASFSEVQERSYLALNDLEGIDLRILQDEGALSELKPTLKAAFRLEMRHEPTLRESYDLMRRNARQINAQPWGLSYGSNFPEKSLGKIEFFETVFPMKMEKWGNRGADNFDTEVDNAGLFLIITTEDNSRTRQIQAGMLFQELWLKAIHEGFSVVPASQPLQEYDAMAEYYAEVHRTFASPGQTIQMIAFLGIPQDGYRQGFRIAADDLVRKE